MGGISFMQTEIITEKVNWGWMSTYLDSLTWEFGAKQGNNLFFLSHTKEDLSCRQLQFAKHDLFREGWERAHAVATGRGSKWGKTQENGGSGFFYTPSHGGSPQESPKGQKEKNKNKQTHTYTHTQKTPHSQWETVSITWPRVRGHQKRGSITSSSQSDKLRTQARSLWW